MLVDSEKTIMLKIQQEEAEKIISEICSIPDILSQSEKFETIITLQNTLIGELNK